MSSTLPEQIRGIREDLPQGEQVLWQGAPDWRVLAIDALHVRAVALYFALLMAWRIGSAMVAGMPFTVALADNLWVLPVAGVALAILAAVAWMSGRTTIYALTTRRVVLRVGIALPIIVNLPHAGIRGAVLKVNRNGSGDIALELDPAVRLAYVHLWPHVRPWFVAHPQPMLRGVAGVEQLAQRLRQCLAAHHPAATAAAAASSGGSEGASLKQSALAA